MPNRESDLGWVAEIVSRDLRRLTGFLIAGITLFVTAVACTLAILAWNSFAADRRIEELIVKLTQEVSGPGAPTNSPTPPRYQAYDGKLTRENGSIISDVLGYGLEVARSIPLGGGKEGFVSEFVKEFGKGLGKGSAEITIDAIKELGGTIWEVLTGRKKEKSGTTQTVTVNVPSGPAGLSKKDLEEVVAQTIDQIRTLIPKQPPGLPPPPSPPQPPPIGQVAAPSPLIIFFPRIGSFSGADVDASIAAAVPAVKSILASHRHCSITVSGHTDTLGSNALNDELALKRARYVAERLNTLQVTTRQESWGPHRLKRLTAENVDEVENRRVEISFECVH